MAKNESTAVNELIERMKQQKPVGEEPAADLFAAKPSPKATTRMTATVPPIRGAGEVAPLPRSRAPVGTQQGLPAIATPAVRISTAPPQRSVTIPPLNQPSSPPTNATIRGTGAAAAAVQAAANSTELLTEPALPSLRQTKPSLPPPHRASGQHNVQQSGQHNAPQSASTMSFNGAPGSGPRASVAPTLPPTTMPIAAPFEPSPIAHGLAYPVVNPNPHAPAHLDMTSNAAWFEQSKSFEQPADEGVIGTARVPKTSDWKSIAGKLIGPMLILVVLGIFIGGFLAFDGDGGKKRSLAKRSAVAAQTPAATDTAATETTETAATETATPEPAKTDEPAAAAEPAKPEPVAVAKAEPEPAKIEPPKVEPKTEPAPVAVAKAEPPKLEPPKPAPVAVAKAEPAKTEPTKVEPVAKPEPAKVEPVAKAEPATTETAIKRAGPPIVDVLIESKPKGATVMLVDRGKTSFLGTTPVKAGVDASRKYELVFTYANKPTQLEPLDPTTTKHVIVKLGKPGNQAKPEAPPSPDQVGARSPAKVAKVEPATSPDQVGARSPAKVAKPEPAAAAVEAPKPEKKERRRTAKAQLDDFVDKSAVVEAPKAEPAVVKAEPKKAPAGEGTLMISSKPPCEIVIDGKPTGLMTPQRSIALPAGNHKITLINNEQGIKKTIAVAITADTATRVIQDLMK